MREVTKNSLALVSKINIDREFIDIDSINIGQEMILKDKTEFTLSISGLFYIFTHTYIIPIYT